MNREENHMKIRMLEPLHEIDGRVPAVGEEITTDPRIGESLVKSRAAEKVETKTSNKGGPLAAEG